MLFGAGTGSGEPLEVFFLAIYTAYAGRIDKARDLFEQLAESGASELSAMSAALKALFRQEIDAAAEFLKSQTLRDFARRRKLAEASSASCSCGVACPLRHRA
jgi:hypothetical protein